jgi:hypothetical protein
MAVTYNHIQADLETLTIEHIDRFNEDGTVSWIPINPANSDYQAYLRWLENPEAKQSIPNLPA